MCASFLCPSLGSGWSASPLHPTPRAGLAGRRSQGSVEETRGDRGRWVPSCQTAGVIRSAVSKEAQQRPASCTGAAGSSGPLPTWGQLITHLHPGCPSTSLGGSPGWICPGRSSTSASTLAAQRRAAIPCALRRHPRLGSETSAQLVPIYLDLCRRVHMELLGGNGLFPPSLVSPGLDWWRSPSTQEKLQLTSSRGWDGPFLQRPGNLCGVPIF